MARRKVTIVICVSNDGYPVSLDVRKVYRALPDAAAEKRGFIRVVDETGEDYLYSQRLFVPVEVSPSAVRKLNLASAAASPP